MIPDRHLRLVLGTDRRVALYGDLARAAVTGAAVILIGVMVIYYMFLARLMFRELHMNDFGKFYYSARLFLDGRDMYGPSPATEIPVSDVETRQFLNMNPPHFHLIVLPLAVLSPGAAIAIWAALSLAALLMSLGIIARDLSITWSIRGSLWLALGTLVTAATGTVIVTGQLTFLLLLPVTAAWSYARRGNWNAAGLLLGMAASVKPFLGIFIVYFLVTRRMGAVLRMFAAMAACGAAGLAVFGPGAYASWLGALSSVEWMWAPMNASISGLFARTLSASPFWIPLIEAPGAVRPLSLLFALGAGVFSLWLLSRDRSPEATDRAFAGSLLTAQVISPLGWIYYLWLVAGPGVALWRTRAGRPSALRTWCLWLAAPGLVCPLVATLAFRDARWAALTLGSTYTWATLLLWSAWVADGFAARRKSRLNAGA